MRMNAIIVTSTQGMCIIMCLLGFVLESSPDAHDNPYELVTATTPGTACQLQ